MGEDGGLEVEKKMKFETEQQVNEIRRKVIEANKVVLKEAHDKTQATELEWRNKAVLALAEGTRNDADLDFEQKEDEATTAGDNYKSAKTEAQNVATLSLPAAKNEVTEAKAAAKASRGLATKEESDLKKKSSTVQ